MNKTKFREDVDRIVESDRWRLMNAVSPPPWMPTKRIGAAFPRSCIDDAGVADLATACSNCLPRDTSGTCKGIQGEVDNLSSQIHSYLNLDATFYSPTLLRCLIMSGWSLHSVSLLTSPKPESRSTLLSLHWRTEGWVRRHRFYDITESSYTQRPVHMATMVAQVEIDAACCNAAWKREKIIGIVSIASSRKVFHLLRLEQST